MTKRAAVFLFGVLGYASALAVFTYLVAFTGDVFVRRTVDASAGTAGWDALATDIVLLALFGLQHSVMARPRAKRVVTRLVPATATRSLYVLLASGALALLMGLWRPLPGTLWRVSGSWPQTVLTALFAAAWLAVLGCTFLVGHFDLLGLRQVTLQLRGAAYTPLPFADTGAFGVVRHPLMLAFLAAFWIAPVMGWGHLVLSLGMTGYMLLGIAFEERDLERAFGERYRRYRERVPMLVPWRRSGLRAGGAAASTLDGPDGDA